jgi:hypothetical protein
MRTDQEKRTYWRAYNKAHAAKRNADAKRRRQERKAGLRPWLPCHAKEYGRARHYGLTVEQFFDMLAAQDNKCAICSDRMEPTAKRSGSEIDHCHRTDKVRGLLCPSCNRWLGALERNPNWPEQARAYLKKHS